jgi:4-hydroxybenzoate polyprenyltransferase
MPSPPAGPALVNTLPADGAVVPGVPQAAARRTGRTSVRALVKTLRPHQWVKNVFVLAPIVFAKDVFLHTPQGPALNLRVTADALLATGIFCLLAGAVYTINDLVDVEADRVHPVKRERPIASGRVSEGTAKAMAIVLVAVSVALSYWLSPWLAAVAVVYFVENLAYSFKLKNIPFIDVGLIALGFVLRVLAGGLGTQVHVSGYMLGCTALLALFLGFGKRRQELDHQNASKQRKSLKAYSKTGLNWALGVTGLLTAVVYVAYTLDPATRAFFHSNYLWLTAPFMAFGIGRFTLLVSGRAGSGVKAESPTQEMLTDVPFVLNLVIYAVVMMAIVYQIRPTP